MNKIIFLSQIHQRFFNFSTCISNVRTLLQPIFSIDSFLLLATQATRVKLCWNWCQNWRWNQKSGWKLVHKVEKNEKKERKTGFLARIGPHTSFTLSFRFASKVRMKIAHRVGKKKRAKQVFLHEYWSSHKFHPQFWSCLLHSFTYTHNLHLNQRPCLNKEFLQMLW